VLRVAPGKLAVGGQADGPNGGSPPGQMRASCAVGRLAQTKLPDEGGRPDGSETGDADGNRPGMESPDPHGPREAAA